VYDLLDKANEQYSIKNQVRISGSGTLRYCDVIPENSGIEKAVEFLMKLIQLDKE
jgi:hypothetical protein